MLHADEEDGFFGLFGFTGKKTPGMFDGVLDMEGGYIKTDECMRTNIAGVFAAGDVRVTPLRQVVTACADGAIAAMQCYKYISAQKCFLKGVHYYAGSDQGKFRGGSSQGRG